MAALDISSALNALKTFYSKDRIEALVYKDRPLFAMLDKKTDFVGDKYKVPMIVARPQGIGSTFATAQSNKTPTNYQAFYLERVKHYALASITTEAVLASQNDAGAFLRLATGEIDGAIDGLTRVIARQCYGDSSAAIAQVSSVSSAAAGVVTLKDPEDIVGIEVGQVLVAWDAKSAGSQHTWSTALGTTATVVGVDRNAGTFTIGATNGGGTTVTLNDYIFVSGFPRLLRRQPRSSAWTARLTRPAWLASALTARLSRLKKPSSSPPARLVAKVDSPRIAS
jgi:hypothetical protein